MVRISAFFQFIICLFYHFPFSLFDLFHNPEFISKIFTLLPKKVFLIKETILSRGLRSKPFISSLVLPWKVFPRDWGLDHAAMVEQQENNCCHIPYPLPQNENQDSDIQLARIRSTLCRATSVKAFSRFSRRT